MSKQAKKGLVPELRFPEFRKRGEWQEVPFNRVVTIHKGKGIAKVDITPDGKLPCIRYGELYTRYAEVIDEVFSRTAVDPADLFLSEAGDVIIPASGETKEDIATAACVLHDGVALGGDLNVLRSDINGPFLSYYINHSKRREIASIAQGHTVVHLYPQQLNALNLELPKPDEQQKIAACLFSVDALLAAEREKLEALRAHKKGLMQQLFPAEGKKVPELRFPGFKGEWAHRPLGEIGDVQMCKRIFAEETNEREGVPFYKIGTLGGKPDAFISQELFEEYKAKYNYPRPGEILITCSGTVGKCVVYDGADAYYQDSNIVWVDNPKEQVINPLLYYLLERKDWKELTSTTITRIYGSDLRAVSLWFPKSKKEQELIALCFTGLDEMTTVQAERVAALDQHKRGLMQGLFPTNG